LYKNPLGFSATIYDGFVIVLLMGVQGSGKTTVGKALAETLDWKFADADDFHSAANKAKMAAGIPLTDADRAPWLASLRREIDRTLEESINLVLACSALKASYRRQLVIPGVLLVYLHGTQELIASRLRSRTGHFAPLDLLATQFAQLEEPHDALTIEIDRPIHDVVEEIIVRAGLRR
jgi:gluconokinase